MLNPAARNNPHKHAGVESLRKARKLATLVRFPEFRRALAAGTAAAIEHRRLPLLADARTVIDVGAHTGQFALLARHRYPTATIHCFEPLPTARGRLSRVLAGDPLVNIHAVAAAQGSGVATMHVSKLDDSSSLLPIADRHVAAFPGTEEATTTEVKRDRIDAVLDANALERPVLLKVDVQGAELEALLGAKAVLAVTDEVLVEVSFMELYHGQTLAAGIVSHLAAEGFNLTGCFNVLRNRLGQCIQADFLFDRRGA